MIDLLKRYWTLAAISALAVGFVVLGVLHLDTRRRLADLEESVGPLALTFASVRNLAGPALDEIEAGLEEFRTSTLTFDVDVDQSLPIETEIPIQRTVQVEIDQSFPIKQSFDTTITVQGPFGVDIPLDVTVPIDVEVPIDLTVPVEIDELVPIETEVPIRLNVPVKVDIAGSELAALVERLQRGLESVRGVLG